MQLPPEQTAHFERIWLALLHDVNEQQHLVPAFPASEVRNGLLPLSDELYLRNALWADETLRERFLSVNPAGLSSADLAVVASWQYRRAGSFYIVRTLKKYYASHIRLPLGRIMPGNSEFTAHKCSRSLTKMHCPLLNERVGSAEIVKVILLNHFSSLLS